MTTTKEKNDAVKTTAGRIGIDCPHCHGPLKTRTSRGITAIYRYLELRCVDIDCAASFGGELAITHAIHPSRAPNPSVTLRAAPPRARVANDDVPVPSAANDDPSGLEVPLAANDDEDRAGEAAG